MEDFNKFKEIHLPQLQANGIPERFWENLWKKLENQVSSGLF